MKTKVTKNIPALIAASLAALAGLTIVLRISDLGIIGNIPVFASRPEGPTIIFWALSPIISAVIGLGTLALAFIKFNAKLNAILVASGLVLIAIASNIALTSLLKLQGWDNATFVNAFWDTSFPETTAASVGNLLWVFAAIAAIISLFINSGRAKASPQATNRFDPETGLPVASAQAAQPAATGGAESSLPLVALILAFFIPLGAVIVGHIAMNQMNQGLISSQNRGMAKAGLFLGYVFIGLSMLLGLIFGIVYFAMLQRSYY